MSLSTLTLKQLRVLAKEHGLKNYSKLKKVDLLDRLRVELPDLADKSFHTYKSNPKGTYDDWNSDPDYSDSNEDSDEDSDEDY